jgi:hypothetical protein
MIIHPQRCFFGHINKMKSEKTNPEYVLVHWTESTHAGFAVTVTNLWVKVTYFGHFASSGFG